MTTPRLTREERDEIGLFIVQGYDRQRGDRPASSSEVLSLLDDAAALDDALDLLTVAEGVLAAAFSVTATGERLRAFLVAQRGRE